MKFHEYFPYRAKIILLLHIEFSNVIDKKKIFKRTKISRNFNFSKIFSVQGKTIVLIEVSAGHVIDMTSNRKKNVPRNSLCVCVGLKPRPFLLSRLWRPSISWYAPMRRWLTVEGVVGAGAWCRGGPTNDRTGRTGQGVVWGEVRGTIDPRMTGQGMTSMRMGQMR